MFLWGSLSNEPRPGDAKSCCVVRTMNVKITSERTYSDFDSVLIFCGALFPSKITIVEVEEEDTNSRRTLPSLIKILFCPPCY